MREGITGGQYKRLTREEIKKVHEASLELLWNPGISVENEEAKEIFVANGASVAENGRVRIPGKMVKDALVKVPKVIKMGARKEENVLVLEGRKPWVHFVTGGCATKIVELEKTQGGLKLKEKQTKPAPSQGYPGGYASLPDFVKITRLIEQLENIDGLSRFMEPDVPAKLQDLVKVFLFLNNTTKHCCLAELVDPESLPKVIRIAEIVAGGREVLRKNPLISFITCLTVSPLRLVSDTTEKFMRIVGEEIPVMISSDPQALSTSLVDEMGQLFQNNAEVLSAVVLSQLVNPGAPVLYGAIPISSNMENLSPQWSSPETIARMASKSQMARFYGMPCYGTAAIPDNPNLNIENPCLAHLVAQKTHSYLLELMGGAQYIHNAFGLWNAGNGFVACPELYVIDDELLARIKFSLRKDPPIDPEERINMIRKAVGSDSYASVFMGDGRRKGRKLLYRSAHFQNAEISWERAFEIKEELLSRPVEHLSGETIERILEEFPEIEEALGPDILSEVKGGRQ